MRACLLTNEPITGVSYCVNLSFCLDFVDIDYVRFFDFGSMHSVSQLLPCGTGTRVPFRVFSVDDVCAFRNSELRQRRSNDVKSLHSSWRELMSWIESTFRHSLVARGHLSLECMRNELFERDCVVGVTCDALLNAIETCRSQPAPFRGTWRTLPSSAPLSLSRQFDFVDAFPNYLFPGNFKGQSCIYARYQTSSARFHLIYDSPVSLVASILEQNSVPYFRPLKRRRVQAFSTTASQSNGQWFPFR